MSAIGLEQSRRTAWGRISLLLLAAALALIALAALWGPGQQSRIAWAANDWALWDAEPVDFERPAPVPQAVAQWAASLQERQGLHRMHHGEKTWIMVAWGPKPTGGYTVDIENIHHTVAGVVLLSVDLRVPAPGEAVTQAITYPYDLVAIDLTTDPMAAQFGTRPTPWLPTQQEGLPMVSENVFLQEPLHGDVLENKVKVKGAAQLFEGTYHVVLEDGHNILLNRWSTASAGGPDWGAIDEEWEFDTPTSPNGLLIIKWQDPASGRWVEELGVPVSFANYQPVDPGQDPQEPQPGIPWEFADMEDHWALAYVNEAVEQGFVHGYPDGTFKPENNVTRAEFLKMVMTAFDFPPTPAEVESPFPDTSGHWAADYVRAGIFHGILTADDYDGQFQPDRAITRLEMAVQLVRALGLSGEIAIHAVNAGYYSDTADLDEEAKGYLGTAVHLGIFEGYPDGTIGPLRTSTRAEAVTVIMRAVAAPAELP